MELRWTLSAIPDLESARRFISLTEPRSATRIAGRILEAVEHLAIHPNLGREGRLEGTRELVVSGSPLVVVYRVLLDQVQVLRILHHARKWPYPPK